MRLNLLIDSLSSMEAIQIICNICIDYNVHDLVLWEKVLDKLLVINYVQLLPSLK